MGKSGVVSPDSRDNALSTSLPVLEHLRLDSDKTHG
jgi:hypothetical protein